MRHVGKMTPLEPDAFMTLRANARVIEADRYGEKVLLLPDDTYLKLFRRKRLLSSAGLYPYAQRFADNLRALQHRGIPCPELVTLYRIQAMARDVVHYRPLVGTTLRHRLRAPLSLDEANQLRHMLGAFVARLHHLGVYFRSLHLGNVVLTPDGQLGLIDVSDMSTQQRPLGRIKRARNMKHLLRYENEAAWIHAGGLFTAAYRDGATTQHTR